MRDPGEERAPPSRASEREGPELRRCEKHTWAARRVLRHVLDVLRSERCQQRRAERGVAAGTGCVRVEGRDEGGPARCGCVDCRRGGAREGGARRRALCSSCPPLRLQAACLCAACRSAAAAVLRAARPPPAAAEHHSQAFRDQFHTARPAPSFPSSEPRSGAWPPAQTLSAPACADEGARLRVWRRTPLASCCCSARRRCAFHARRVRAAAAPRPAPLPPPAPPDLPGGRGRS